MTLIDYLVNKIKNNEPLEVNWYGKKHGDIVVKNKQCGLKPLDEEFGSYANTFEGEISTWIDIFGMEIILPIDIGGVVDKRVLKIFRTLEDGSVIHIKRLNGNNPSDFNITYKDDIYTVICNTTMTMQQYNIEQFLRKLPDILSNFKISVTIEETL